MIAKWGRDDFVEALQKFNGSKQRFEEAKAELEEYLENLEAINYSQRIILLAEQFDPKVLFAAEWLTEKYKVNIRCYRLTLARQGSDEFLTCYRVYPPPEISDMAIRERARSSLPVWTDWDSALQDVTNDAVTKFVRDQVGRGVPNRPQRRTLSFQVNNKARYWVKLRRNFAYCMQRGRFESDREFWASRLGPGSEVKERRSDTQLRFRLTNQIQFDAFLNALQDELPMKQFVERDDQDEEPDDNE
jgi:hypothetical protein